MTPLEFIERNLELTPIRSPLDLMARNINRAYRCELSGYEFRTEITTSDSSILCIMSHMDNRCEKYSASLFFIRGPGTILCNWINPLPESEESILGLLTTHEIKLENIDGF
jgi:hypothetical protein